jgi:hypothetical protein
MINNTNLHFFMTIRPLPPVLLCAWHLFTVAEVPSVIGLGGGLFGLRYQPADLVMLPVSALCSTINLGELEHAVCVAGLFPDALTKDPNSPRKGVGRNLLFPSVFPCAFGQRGLCAQSSATKRIRKSVRFTSRNFRRPPFFVCAQPAPPPGDAMCLSRQPN